MKEELLNLIEKRSPGAIPLFLAIRGSHAYGTNIETSDTDFAGVFIQPIEDILSFNYKEQINDDNNDIVIYEVRRFIDLLSKSNPTVLELLNTPEDCVIYKHPVFDLILNNRDKFITKICALSFGGYAKAQITKAKGQDKKQNWSKDRVVRKNLLDFCYVIRNTNDGEVLIPWESKNSYGYLENGEMKLLFNKTYNELFIGATKIPKDARNKGDKNRFRLYYDETAESIFDKNVSDEKREELKEKYRSEGKALGLGYKGLVKVGDSDNLGISNQLRLSSIPKGEEHICDIFYDQDAYSTHCREYREYQEWLEKKNDQRWVDVKGHGQKIDGKNMLHCFRLIDMAFEIASGQGVIVRRPNREQLIAIRKGEVDLRSLIYSIEDKIKEMDILFKNSDLPDNVDFDFANDLLLKIRQEIYGIDYEVVNEFLTKIRKSIYDI